MSATATQTLTIRIEMTPDSCLSPNRTKGLHWGNKGIRKAERDLHWATWKGLDDADYLSWPVLHRPVTVRITVFWEKGRKLMDGDNMLSSLKRGCIDVIARGSVVNDRHFRFVPIEQIRDPDGLGYMVVKLEGSE